MTGIPPEVGLCTANESTSGPTGEVTLLEAASIVLEHRRLVVGLPLLLGVVVVLVSLVLPRVYSASASFAPQATSGTLGGLASLANQFGVTISGGSESESPDFYADLLTSNQVLREVVGTQYTLVEGGDSIRGDLVSFYNIAESTPAESREKAIEQLRDNLGVSVGLKTGVVKFTARARHASLAQAIAQRALECLNEFNLRARRSQATAQRAFIGGRVEEAAQDLRQAEDRLQAFLQRNRDYRGSPQLAFEHDRLQREVDLRHQVYTTLVQAFEQAKIDEVRNTPILTVVEEPFIPAKPDSRFLALKALMALLVGTLVALTIAFAREFMQPRPGADAGEAVRLEHLRREALADLSRPWRLFKSRPRTGTG